VPPATRSFTENEMAALPPDLRRCPPRPVRLTAAGKLAAGLAVALAGAAVAAGISLHAAAVKSRSRLEGMRREALVTQARVVQARVSGGRNRRLIVRYEYEAGGKLLQGVFRTDPRRARQFRPGSQLSISFLPSEPARSWPVGGEPQGVPFWAGPVVAAELAGLAVAIGIVIRRQRRLLEEGRPALATVISIEPRRARSGYHRVSYEFSLLNGARARGWFQQRKAPPLGSQLRVVYDPENPRWQRRYPFPLVRVGWG